MFALWYLSFAIDEIRKRLGYPSLFSSQKSDVTIPTKPEPIKPEVKRDEVVKPKEPEKKPQPEKKAEPEKKPEPTKVEPVKKPESPKIVPKTPQQSKNNGGPSTPTVKQPESPETQELIKTYEIPEKDDAKKKPDVINGAGGVRQVSPKPKETPKTPTTPTTPTTPSKSPSPSPVKNGNLAGKAKSPKDATSAFLVEESTTKTRVEPATKRNKSDTMVDAATLEKLEAGFAKLAASDSKSLLKKYLTKEVFDALKTKKTPSFGSSLLDCVQSGFENHDSGVGIYAPDAEAYSVFSDLFDPIIEDYHAGFKKTDKHPPRNFGDVDTFGNLDPAGEFVISTRVRCGRSMEGYPFNPCLTEAQYKEMEQKVSTTLSGLEGELKGKFYPLTGMEKAVQQQLIDDHFLFKEGDRFLQAANACRFWPSGRGIYHNDAKTFLVWCNEEDHLRIISMQMGGDLGQVYRRLVTAVNDIEKRIPFSHHDRLGFLTFCPTNLGTTIRASVHIKVPKLAANKARLEEVAGKYNLQVRGTRGEHTEAEGGVYDISNKRRMGLTEYDAVKEMYDGIAELIKIEKSL
ncbi:arginine kinase 1 isoform X1 [Phlebotomus papatasi]|uniref:arginine kinase 1 isoform X1 n=2 Tax=Phlebotomus papatasi TaxID=29031 RepID=UPI0024835FB7|nr:arginine kinase 1 isoform X1 [Phlebotomus papatasi]